MIAPAAMRHRSALLCTIAATVLAWAVWLFIVAAIDPTAAHAVGVSLFYITFWFAISGTAVIMGVALRRHTIPWEDGLRIAIRQGVLVGLGVAAAVALQSHQLLSWINFLLLIAALTLLELFWISLRTHPVRNEEAHG